MQLYPDHLSCIGQHTWPNPARWGLFLDSGVLAAYSLIGSSLMVGMVMPGSPLFCAVLKVAGNLRCKRLHLQVVEGFWLAISHPPFAFLFTASDHTWRLPLCKPLGLHFCHDRLPYIQQTLWGPCCNFWATTQPGISTAGSSPL